MPVIATEILTIVFHRATGWMITIHRMAELLVQFLYVHGQMPIERELNINLEIKTGEKIPDFLEMHL